MTSQTAWTMGSRACTSLIHLAVGVAAARILGPEGYGQIQYAVALSGMLMPLCTLGLRDVLVPELVRCPRNGGAVVGSAVVMRLVASLGAVGLCALGTWLDSPAQGNAVIVLLYSISLIPAALEPLGDWFRAELRTAVPAVAACVAAAGAGLCQVGLLRAGMGAGWFALAHSLEALGAGLLLAYRRGPHRRLLRWDGERGRALFKKSRHYIFSGFLVALYGRVDRLILQKMLGQEAVGLYAVAASVSTMWTLVPAALVEAARPAILSRRDRSPDDFRQGLARLYSLIWYGSCLAAAGICLLSRPLLLFLYGEAYLPAWPALCICAWCPAFSYLGTARSIFLAAHNDYRYEKYVAGIGVASNLIFHGVLTTRWGIWGAALAALLTQAVTNVGAGCCIPALRENSRLIWEGMKFRTLRMALAEWKRS